MAEFTYPSTDLDSADKMMSLLGSFWADTYQGNDFVSDLVFSTGQQAAQTHRNLLELIAAVSRFDIPVFHKDHWFLLELKESELSSDELAIYGETEAVYDPSSGLEYGLPEPKKLFTFPKPEELVSASLILNRITDSSVTWTEGVDYKLDKHSISFRTNPFDDDLIPKADNVEDGEIVDRVVGLWVFMGDFDWGFVYEQLGYVLNRKMSSSQGYKDVVNAVLDSFVEGSNLRQVQMLFSAISGIPIVKEATETIEEVFEDGFNLVIVSDSNVYKFPSGVTSLVSVGDQVSAGDSLTDIVQIYEFNRGEVSDNLRALSVGKNFLTHGFHQELVFENKEVNIEVSTGADGYTRVEFEIGGFPGDVEKFWDDLHANGVAAGQTLAHLLDTRTNKVGEPAALALPKTINPLEFLAKNVLRNNAIVVRLITSGFASHKLGLDSAALLSKMLPPHTGILLVVELEHSDDPVIMDGAGTETSPGYGESLATFQCMHTTDSIGPASLQEVVRLRLIGGKCE
jgi:hypothetical protein